MPEGPVPDQTVSDQERSELYEELNRLSLPFTEEATPSEAELRIGQAQLVGWLVAS